MKIQKAFVEVEGRRVHYRRCGAGPVLLLLHQSPKSSREYEPLMAEWGAHFTCIAPDTPGYGFSQPLPGRPRDLAAYADATCAFLDALGLEQPLVYGFHTGAAIAAELAARHPDRVRALVANGYVVLTEQERNDFLMHYLPEFVPSWDGSHLAWLWARLREQVIFFPWYQRTRAARMVYDMPPPEVLHENAMEFLHAGDHYRDAYGAAFRWEGERVLPRITVPALVIASDKDPLCAHLQRLPSPPPNCEITSCPTQQAVQDRALAFFRSQSTPDEASPIGATGTYPATGYVSSGSRQIRLRHDGKGTGRPVLMLHDIGEQGDLVETNGEQSTIIPDLPGHGLSDPADGPISLPSMAEALNALLVELDAGPVTVRAKGVSCLIAAEMQRIAPDRVLNVDADLVELSRITHWADYCRKRFPALEPNVHGGHLLEAWLVVRNGALFEPWYEQRAGSIVQKEPDISPPTVHRKLIALLDSLPTSHAVMMASIDYPFEQRLRQLAGS